MQNNEIIIIMHIEYAEWWSSNDKYINRMVVRYIMILMSLSMQYICSGGPVTISISTEWWLGI